jgi:predicted phage terminase large subunit-like protein
VVLEDQDHAPAAHHLAMMAALEAVADGRTPRLMLLLPPGSAKSTYASELFPAWWLARHPRGAVIAASHTASLAEHFGRRVRRLLTAHGARLDLTLRADAHAASRFATECGGEYFAIGVRGAVTGRRADLALIDDPIASFADAASRAGRDHLWDWYRTELLTRLKPNAAVVVVMTRWHRDDLAGRLLEQPGWTVLRLPALAEEGDPLGRDAGDALWPGWEDRAALLAKREAVGEPSFAAMYQQAPMPEAGTLFGVDKLTLVDTPPLGPAVRGWDLASGTDPSRDPDWTVGVLLARDGDKRFVVDDVRRARVGPEALDAFVLEVAQRDGTDVAISLPRDPGQASAYQIMSLIHTLAGFRVRATAETGPKPLRAGGIASQVCIGNVQLRRAPWNRDFIEELAMFPNGRKDDQVDALSRAFAMLAPAGAPARFVSIPILGR